MKNTDAIFALLSKLLYNKPERIPILEDYSIQLLDLQACIEDSDYPEKTFIVNSLNKLKERMKLLIQFQWLKNKNIIGVYGDRTLTYLKIKSIIYNGHYAINNKNIITAIYSDVNADHNKLDVVNLHGAKCIMDKSEYAIASNLYSYGIDICNIAEVYCLTGHNYENIVFFDIPMYAKKNGYIYDNVQGILDYVIISDRWADKTIIDKIVKENEQIKVILLSPQKVFEEKGVNFMSNIPCDRMEKYNIDNIVTFFEEINQPNVKIDFSTQLQDISIKYLMFQKRKHDKYQALLKGLRIDALYLEDENTKNVMKDVDKSTRVDYDEIASNIKSYTEKLNVMLAQTTQVDAIVSNEMVNRIMNTSTLENLILNYILIGENEKALCMRREFKDSLKAIDFVYELYLSESTNDQVLDDTFIKLQRSKSKNDIVVRAKIKYRKKIGLNELMAGELAQKLNNIHTGEEHYVLAEYYINTDKEKARYHYKRALELDFMMAGERLIEHYEYSSIIELLPLAEKLVPKACYRVGKHALSDNHIAKGYTYLRIAAALKNYNAIKDLAMDLYKRNDNTSMNNALRMFLYLTEKNINDYESFEYLGKIYYKFNDIIKAKGAFEKSKSAESYFLLGRIYQYGDGVSQDIQLAKQMFENAIELKHPKAEKEYEKVKGWIEKNAKKREISNSRDYTTKRSYYQESSGCFITTATCMALSKGDNCDELVKFRFFRDNYLSTSNEGRELIRQYYFIAPTLVKMIDDCENPAEEYRLLWNNFICLGYEKLCQGKHTEAKNLYIEMIKYLIFKFH